MLLWQPEKKEDYDFTLISRYGVLGTAVFPPILFYWYKWLDARYVGTAVKTIATKVVFDQAVSAPIILGLFYIGNKNFRFFFFFIILLQHSKIQAWVWWKAVQTFFKSFVRNSWILLRWVFLVEKMRFLSSVSKMHEKEITDFFKEKSSSNWCGCMAWTMLYVIFHLTMNSA